MNMKKYILFGLIVIVVAAVVGFFIYQSQTLKSSDNTIQFQQKLQSNTSIIQFNEGATIINPEDKNCNLDNDCVLFQPDCEDCQFDILNNKTLQKYIDAKKEYCNVNKPKKQCDIVFTGSIKCINNMCSLN